MSFHPAIPAELATASQRPAAVFGLGASGKALLALLAKLRWPAVAYDEREGEDVRRSFGAAEVSGHGIVIHSPGFAPTHPWVATARRAGIPVLGEVDFAARFWRGPVVAITGTNGKTTLTEFLAFALKRRGNDAVACGNNGYAVAQLHALEVQHPVTAVMEVSSFQAETLERFRADAVIWTNFDEDHLDRHPSLGAYFRAKFRLVEASGAPVFAGESVLASAKEHGIAWPVEPVLARAADVAGWVLPSSSAFAFGPQLENLALARAWWLSKGLPEAELREAAAAFGARRHRLSRVAVVSGVEWWNDSKGTNFHATRAALAAFPGRRVHWIGGGLAKGGDLAAFARSLAATTASAQLVGTIAPELAARLAEAAYAGPLRVHPGLEAAVRAAAALAREGEVVLMSPGFASFDQFRDYADRGATFERLVNDLRINAAARAAEAADSTTASPSPSP